MIHIHETLLDGSVMKAMMSTHPICIYAILAVRFFYYYYNNRHWTVVRMVEVQATPLTHRDAISTDSETLLSVSSAYM